MDASHFATLGEKIRGCNVSQSNVVHLPCTGLNMTWVLNSTSDRLMSHEHTGIKINNRYQNVWSLHWLGFPRETVNIPYFQVSPVIVHCFQYISFVQRSPCHWMPSTNSVSWKPSNWIHILVTLDCLLLVFETSIQNSNIFSHQPCWTSQLWYGSTTCCARWARLSSFQTNPIAWTIPLLACHA